MIKDGFFLTLIAGGALVVGTSLFAPEGQERRREARRLARLDDEDLGSAVAGVDSAMRAGWEEAGFPRADRAPDLLIMRRIALGLMGTIPSLEDIRRFEEIPEDKRIAWWVDRVLDDRRSAQYLAERFARATVGVKGGPFLIYRRRRFVAWLEESLTKGRPYDELVREMIASEGLWTDRPATNFITAEVLPERNIVQPVPLAGRVSRAFLGIRMDCAECHDHPFDRWTQEDFHGLAAFFSRTKATGLGIKDRGMDAYSIQDRETQEPVVFDADVPFGADLLPGEGRLRERLARWVTHPDNPAFARATVNRVWGLMLGRPLIQPVDDIPTEGPYPAPLEALARDFSTHGYDWRRLVKIIALSEAFQLDSRYDGEVSEDAELAWAVRPLTRLRPEQVVGSIEQSASLTTIDEEAYWLFRFVWLVEQNDFLKRYGDTGEDQFDVEGGTIPQRLLLMNGKILRERTEANIINAAGRIAQLAADDAAAVETAFLCTLTRRPTEAERAHFVAGLADTKGKARGRALEDLYWSLANCTEFSWNH